MLENKFGLLKIQLRVASEGCSTPRKILTFLPSFRFTLGDGVGWVYNIFEWIWKASNTANIPYRDHKKVGCKFWPVVFCPPYWIKDGANLSHKPWSSKNNFFKIWACCIPFCWKSYTNSKLYKMMGKNFTSKKLLGVSAVHTT